MAVSGPIARSIGDIHLGLEAMSGSDPADPWHTMASISRGPFPRKAALSLSPDGMVVEGPIKDALIAAAKALEAAGWIVEDRPCPPMRPAAEINAKLWMAETKFAAEDLIKRENEPDSLYVYEQMRRDAGEVNFDILMQALQSRVGLIRQWETFLAEYPVILCPVSGMLPFDQQLDVQSEESFRTVFEAQLPQRAVPTLGLPALAVATGEANGRPTGVQLIAGRFREDVLLAAGREIELALAAPVVAEPV